MTKQEQICYPTADGFLICNCVMHNGVCVETKSGKWWKFPLLKRLYKRKRLKESQIEVAKIETAPTPIKK